MGSVVVSVDAELGWGFHDLESPPRHRVEAGRRGWRSLLSLFDRYDVPATWAVVGHLMLEDCDGRHHDHPAPPTWFERERTAWADRPDLRFGRELVGELLASPVDHEFASHSFSHVLFGADWTSRRLADAETRRAREVAADWGLEPTSFVYPRNDVGHREALAKSGFTAYRGRTPTPEGIRAILETGLGGKSLLVEPHVDRHGLVNVPASLFLFGFEGRLRSVAEPVFGDPMVQTARRAIDQATAGDGVCHLWVHPNNLTHPRDDDRMRAILAHVDRRRADGLIVETMADVADRVLEAGDAIPTAAPTGSGSEADVAADD